jgi:hypothetical protein
VNCPNCGTSNLDNASICVNCGRPLAAVPPPPPPQVSYTPPAQPSYTPPPASSGPGYGQPMMAGTPIPNYLWQSIVVTLCCCLPFGIVAIIFAAQVNDKLRRGDVAGATQASKNAKTWVLVAFLCGLVAIVIYGLAFSGAIMQAIREAQANR